MCAAPMASTAQPQQQPQQQQEQQPVAAAAVPTPAPPASEAQPQKPTRVSLSYEEISKLFSLPIAEAASILGVCTSVLKRICRSHGIVRWPYRKLVSGKSGDDTKNAEREKAKGLLEISKVAKQKALSASGLSTVSGYSVTVQLHPSCNIGCFMAVSYDHQALSKEWQNLNREVRRQDKSHPQENKMCWVDQQSCPMVPKPKASQPTWTTSSTDFHHLACLCKL
ncbi:hypothetical protein DAI22_01g102200 [Oryza sativa Japonica Group]|nr:hypothetical protein DAI22_01g102200 [Oryza sativa Japonica Group]